MNAWDTHPALQPLASIPPAIARTRAMLFGPIFAGVWLRFGLIVFAEYFYLDSFLWQWFSPPPGDAASGFAGIMDEMIYNSLVLLADHTTVVAIFLGVSSCLQIVIKYIHCRGQLMLAGACAAGAPSLLEDWRGTRRAAHSLYGLHLCLLIVAWVVFMPSMALYFAAAQRLDDLDTARGMVFAALALGCIVTTPLVIFTTLTRSFVVPIMNRDGVGWLPAWRLVGPVLAANVAAVTGYLILRVAYIVALVVTGLFAGCATLCIGFLPLVSETLLAPMHVFERNWSMFMLERLGPEYRVFQEYETEAEFPPQSDELGLDPGA